MPTGPRGERRPADVIGWAVAVARLSVGDDVETLKTQTGKVRSGIAGAKARTDVLTAGQREAVEKKAANARWR